MSLRRRLILWLILLSVVPLAGVTVYSYVTSRRAFEQAVQAEAGALADEMGSRMGAVTADLERRFERLERLPLARLLGPGDSHESLLGRMQTEMGDVAPLVESFELADLPPVPTPPAPHSEGRDVEAPPDVADVPEPPAPGKAPLPPVQWRRWVWDADKMGKQGEELAREIQRSVDAALRAADAARRGAPKAHAPESAEHAAIAREAVAEAARAMREARGAERAAADRHRKEMQLLLGRRDFDFTVRRDGAPVAKVRALVRAEDILGAVLSRTGRRKGEIPFAVDREGRLHTADPQDAARLKGLPLTAGGAAADGARALDDWVVVTRKDPASGLVLGIARPVGESLKEIRRTAARNLAGGLGLVGLALVGIVPLSRRMTRNISLVAEGAERLAAGDLDARVEVRSKDEIGRLAGQFNRMAAELKVHQEKLLEQERLRKELEIGRRIQSELLPRDPLRLRFAEVQGVSIPAREVGGDFFNYFVLPEGDVALLVGDVSGKGVPAALLMANAQATLRARLAVEHDLASLADTLDREIDKSTPAEAYVTLFMGVLDGPQRAMRYVNAGHNTQFLVRSGGGVEPLESTGRPLGLYPGGGYAERRVALAQGDCLFLFTDGLVEAENEAGEPFGEHRLHALLQQERSHGLDDILARVEAAVREHRGDAEAADDATMVVLRIGGAEQAV
jgi:serine phosphatase RsbU (regulator of sigma subunit)